LTKRVVFLFAFEVVGGMDTVNAQLKVVHAAVVNRKEQDGRGYIDVKLKELDTFGIRVGKRSTEGVKL